MAASEGVIQNESELHPVPVESATHTFLFDIVAFFSNCQTSLIAEYCQEIQNWNSIQRFIDDENTHILPIFFCDPQERNRFSKRSTIALTQTNRLEKPDENCIGIGLDKSFEDGGVIFLKPNAIKLTDKNYKNELVIFSMNFDQQNLDLLVNLETVLLSYLPSIKKADEWKKLNLFTENIDRLKFHLIYQIEQNAEFFRTIHTSFTDAIQLQKVPLRLRDDSEEVINPNSLLRFAQDAELIQQAEETMNEWIKAIENFYQKSRLIRQIMSDSGPLNEIKYWRKQVIQLHSIMNQLRLPSNRAVIYLLNIAASSRSIEWKEIDKKLTQSINEARDHYKFLMIIAKHIGPLYRNDPHEIQENLNNLLNTIVLINSCSEYYSKPEKIAGLLVSINNQMVISCQNYLTNNHTIDIRLLDRKELLKRLENITNLYGTCREIFLKIKQKIENHSNDHLSERHLLGKFDFLNQRLNQLREIIQSFEIYSLLSQSRIDGLEPIISIYKKIQNEFLTFKFDFFNPNDQQFDLFYNQLNHLLSDIDQKLYQIFAKDLHDILHSPSHNSFNALKLLLRYENLHIPFFDSKEFLIDIIQWYEKEELERVKNIYNQCRNVPKIERDHPAIVGRILWARRMYKRIQIPYVEFLQRDELKNHSIMKKITNDFLMISNGFSIYELLYHRHWYQTLPDVINVMCNPLLIRQNVLRQLYINYDPMIDVIFRECELLARYSITMPDLGYKLLLDQNRIRLYYERLKTLLKNLSALLAKAHPASYELVEKVMTQVDSTLSIGLNRLNWLSKNLDELFLPAEEKIHLMSDFLDQIASLIIYRIEEPINEISHFEILEFPDDSIDLKQFVDEIRQQMIFKAEKLNSLSSQIESAVLHVIKMFFDKLGYTSKPFEHKIGNIDLMQLSTIQKLAIQMFVQNSSKSKNPTQLTLQPSNEWERFNELCNDFLSSFETRFIDALTLCAKNTFEMMKHRVNPTLIQMKPRIKKLRLYPLDTIDANADRKDHFQHPLILTHVELQSSVISLNPSIDEVQQLMHQLVNYVLNIFHGVRKWGEVRPVDSKLIHNYPMYDFSELLPTDGHSDILNNAEENSKEIQQVKTYYNTIANNKELIKLYHNIGNYFVENSNRLEKELEEYSEFRDLWETNKVNQAKKFILSNPGYAAIRSIFSDFDDTRDLIKRISDWKDIEPFRYLTTKFQGNLFDEIRQLELIFAKYIRLHYRTKFLSINDFFKKNEPRLNRQLRDLDDVRFVIHTLDTLKENFVQIDQTIDPLEEVYNLFKRYSIDIPQEEQLSIEMLRNAHERLLKRAKYVTHELVNTQQSFLDPGTGKTETTKDMARTLGKYCIVQNCSDQFDYRGLGKTFKGLAISGCWGCFDEFNRINLPVLSVAAQQIQCLLQAKRERRKEFLFTDGDKITFNDTFAIIITMNPGYAGRQELPENLKINFRSVAMMVPDRQIIMRVKLASGGFLENTNLAQKFFTLYKCCEDQLSKQVHYDYGLRNITAVLRTLGTVKRSRSKDPEETIVMRVLRDMNLSKLIDEDERLFLSLLEDLFPGIKLDKEKYDDLQKAITEKIQEDGLINYNDWNLKVIQLYETQLVRHGIMVLGPSGAGKTKCCQVLMGALTILGTHTRDYRMNPKSITASQMFGILDVATNDWTDGIFSTLWRRTLKAYEISSKSGIREAWWIILDGPVDAIWIENLNSVLDDNKLLTLANGDRIPMASNVKLIFEVHNIDNASPATVSRCGMIFMSSTVLPWRPIFQAWVNKQIKNLGIYIFDLLEKHFDELFKLLITKCSPKMKVYECNYIKQIIDLFDGLLNKEIEYTKIYLERLTVFSLMWSMGALLELNDRAKLEQYFLNCHDIDIPKNIAQGDSIFDYLVNDHGQWEHWSTRVEPWEYPKDEKIEFASILVPNIDNVRITYLINILSKQGKAVLLIGEPGTAKTVIITSYLKHYDSEQHLTRIMNFSSITTNNFIQKTIENFVDKRVANTFGPSFGRQMTIFIDDINMPMINSWGDQEANEILRQLMEQKGFYSLTKPGDFLSIIDLQFLAAMCHPGGGRNDIPERLKRHFFILNCTLPSNNAVDHIFGSIGKYFSSERNFSNEVIHLVEKSISATRILWQNVKGKFLPTPAKFHYIFNLRDLSRIWEGILQIDSEQFQKNIEEYLQLWKHECTRVLADRLVLNTEKEWFRKEQFKIAKQTFGDIYQIPIEENSEVYFANFLREELEVTDEMGDDIDLADLVPKVYESISSWDVLQTKLMDSMKKMNEEIRGSHMDLVFFKDAMIHLLRISRVINMPKGHLLLVGVGGSGKQSLTKLAAYIAGYKYFQISISRTYTLNNFLDDLRNIYRRAGRLGQGIVFILTDNDIKDDQFLEYLNNVLSSGEVSGLITREEMDETLSELSVKMKKEYPKRALTNENLLNYYRERLRKNLHIVLCFSPDNRKFRERALKFPALVSGCTIDWFHRWPLDALVAVSEVYLNRFDILVKSSTIKKNVVELMADIHNDVSRICENYYEKFRRRTYVTPKSFLSFINAFKLYYQKQREYFEKEKQKMKTGVQKLFEAAEQVQEITQELITKEKHMAIANEEAAKQVSEMEVLRSAAEMKTKEVHESKETAEILVKQVNEEKAIAEEELLAAEVILKEAEEAVKQIKGNTISNLRKLAKPPEAIMIVLDMALILMKRRLDPIRIDTNLEEPFYASSKAEILRLLNFSGLLSTLLTIRELNDEIIELLAPYSEIKDLSEKARKAYKDLATLKTWTDKIQSYHAINKEVIPIKDKVQKAENSLRKASRKLARAERELERTEIGLAKCQQDFDSAMQTKKTYQADYDALLKRRDDANTLISGLTGEKVRWNEQNKAFEQSIEKLIGNAILVTAFLSYCGPFNQEFRQRMINEWQKQIQQRTIPFSENFNLIEQLNDEATIGEWNLQGLPNDDLSIQNGIIATSNYRSPLLIDPQLQGKSWIKNLERENDLLITTLNSKLFRQQLEDSISLGRPLLIEDVDEELDPILDNILEKNYLKIGLTLRVKIGDREVDVNHLFRLYITTKLANPNYTPEVCARVSIIDFTVTQRGLEDQLLSLVIANERVELERERVTLARETTKNKRLLKELEENLLIKLTSIEGSVLDDPSLVEVLNANKRIAIEVKEKVAIAEETKIKISTAREEYRPVAIRGSIIYFLMSEIALVNHMYQISLQQFLGLFHESMQKSNKIAATQKRIQNINDYLTYRTWFYTTRGLYEEDRLMFTLLMTLRIDLRRGKIRYDEFEVLIKGGASLDLNTCPTKPFRWLNDLSWLNLLELSRIKEFHDVIDRLQKNERAFKDWFEKESINLPETYDNLHIFHRFLFIRCISPDRTIFETRNYIQDSLGMRYSEIPVLRFEFIWEESDGKTPLLGLLSSGADPTSNIQALAKKKMFDLYIVSMGQGQEILARRYLQQTMISGGWLLLQNAHLGLDYLEEFHETLMATENFEPSFRVWLTTETHPQFPIQILQSSIKFTNEPPQGVRAGLKRTYGLITQDKLEYIETMHWRPMLYATSFLHSIVQERRKFGPLGWNIPYGNRLYSRKSKKRLTEYMNILEFNQTDWEASVQYIQNHLDDMNPKLGVSWKALRYMISEIQYGGRITDDRDRRLMITYAKKWFTDSLFSSDFKFYDSYSIPQVKRLDEYFDYIDKLPLIDPPQIFGLHPNADITYSTNRAKSMLEKIVNIQPKEVNSNSSTGETRDKIVQNIANDMLSKLPANFIQHEIREKLGSMGILNPMIIFLRQEIHRIDRVIRTVRNSLNDLQLAIDGIIILNDSLRQTFDSIYDGRVPIDWTRYSWQSSTLGFWFSELLDRYTQYNNWLNYGRPKCFWMTGFFNPNGFLTAMRQEVTRMHKGWSLDTVTIDNLVLRSYKDDIREAPTEGVYVYGLYLEGAGWDRKNARLHESQNKVVYVQMPVIHIFAINPNVTNPSAGIIDKKSRFSFRGKRTDQISIAPYIYLCPVYKKPMRTDLHFITMLKLPSNDIPEHWILRGVALLCDIK